MTMDRVDAYLESHRGDFEEQLKALIRIPSISAQPDHDPDTRRAATFIRDDLAAMGLKTELIETKKHPIVYAEWLGAPGKPTILIYGHYDVQPPEPLEPWLSPPFEPTVRDGNLYARGATDDKGQMFTHLKAVEAWLKTAGKLPVNVKIVIEGEEEVGGVSLEAYVPENKKKLACDFAVISDSSQFGPGQPAITYGLKGLAYFELLVQGANRDLHSGTYGGRRRQSPECAGHDPRQLEGRRTARSSIAGFYDAVKPLEDWERAEFAKLAFSEAEFQADLRVPSLEGEAGYTTLERKWARPTCDINGIFGGYAGPGPQDRAAMQGGREAQFPPGARPGPQDGRAAIQGTRRQGLPAGRDLRDHQPPRCAGCPGQCRYARRQGRGPRHRGQLRHQARFHARRGLDPGRRADQAAPGRRYLAPGLGPERR